jgi:hypothetical protein
MGPDGGARGILVQMRSNAKAVVMFVLLAVEAYAHLPM